MAKVDLYTWTNCPYCTLARKLLRKKEIHYSDITIDGDDEKKLELFERTGQETVPFVFINDNFIGGFSELQNLASSGKLDEMCGMLIRPSFSYRFVQKLINFKLIKRKN